MRGSKDLLSRLLAKLAFTARFDSEEAVISGALAPANVALSISTIDQRINFFILIRS